MAGIRTAALAAVLGLCAGCAIYVDDDSPCTTDCGSQASPWPTIQQAVDAAQEGARILVCPGLYREAVVIDDKGLEIKSVEGAAATVVDGTGYYLSPLLTIRNVASSLVLDGFTLQHGGSAELTGGIYVDNANAVLRNNIVRQNNSHGSGGGITVNASTVEIANNLVYGNQVFKVNFGNVYGGGIYVKSGTARLLNNTVVKNSLIPYRLGGGKGGGIYLEGGTAVLQNNVVAYNSLTWPPSVAGGGLVCNEPIHEIEFNDIWNNALLDVYGCGDLAPSNLSLDPGFADPELPDFHLTALSPCIDRGDDLSAELPPTDFEGDPRRVDGDGDGTPEVDMGADEFLP